jgi:hypothetical protein
MLNVIMLSVIGLSAAAPSLLLFFKKLGCNMFPERERERERGREREGEREREREREGKTQKESGKHE